MYIVSLIGKSSMWWKFFEFRKFIVVIIMAVFIIHMRLRLIFFGKFAISPILNMKICRQYSTKGCMLRILVNHRSTSLAKLVPHASVTFSFLQKLLSLRDHNSIRRCNCNQMYRTHPSTVRACFAMA